MRFRWLPALLLAAPAATAADPVSITKTADAVEFKVNGTTATTYHVGPKVFKPYLYPVLAPNGAAVTRGWPLAEAKPGETTDHPHQKSAWFCHGDVIPEGIELKTKSANKGDKGIDFWADPDSSASRRKAGEIAPVGKIVCTSVGEPKQVSPDHASVETKNDWLSPDGVKVMSETRTVHLKSLPAGRLYVFDIDLHADVCPITFGDTKEGSFGVRVNDTIREANKSGDGKLTNSAGQSGEKAVWGHFADWCDYAGTIDGKQAGIAVFADPKNPSKPAWHARGYGLMAANPFGREHAGFPDRKGQTDLVKIAKGDHLKLRFGIYAHDGDTAAGKVAEAFAAFSK